MMRCGRGGTLLATLLLLAACARPKTGESIIVRSAGRITGSAEDGGFESFVLLSAPMPDGRRVAIRPDTPSPAPVLVLGADGLIADTLAMPGNGPGQIARARRLLVGRGDTLFIFAQSRVHVYSPELVPVRTFPVSVHTVWSAVQLGSGDLALASATFGDNEPVVVVSAADGMTRWAMSVPTDASGSAPSPIRMVARGPDGSLWVGGMTRRLEFLHYNAAGALLDSLVLEREWFPPTDPSRAYSRDEPRPPSLSGFWVDTLGRLWLVGRGTDPEWREAEGEDKVGEGGITYFEPKRLMDVQDGVIEAVDPSTGRSLAMLRTDSLFGMVQAPWILSRFPANEDGWVQVELSRVTGRF